MTLAGSKVDCGQYGIETEPNRQKNSKELAIKEVVYGNKGGLNRKQNKHARTQGTRELLSDDLPPIGLP